MVIDMEADFVYLADGAARRMDNPKRKKQKHIIFTNYTPETKLNAISDSVIRKMLSEYSKR